jgi:uncharacterized protein
VAQKVRRTKRDVNATLAADSQNRRLGQTLREQAGTEHLSNDVLLKSISKKKRAMRTKLLHEQEGKRTFAVILETGDEAMACLETFAKREHLGGAQLTAIGALSGAKLSYFDWEKKSYSSIPVEEQVEVAAFLGDIAVDPDGSPSVHAHAVLGRRDGQAVAGHVEEAHVRPTLEIIVTESPSHLCKAKDPESGLALIRS